MCASFSDLSSLFLVLSLSHVTSSALASFDCTRSVSSFLSTSEPTTFLTPTYINESDGDNVP